MRNVDSNFLTALTSARDTGIVPRKFIWIAARDRETGAIEGMGLWTGDEDITVTLISAQTGQSTTRLYLGAGALVSVSSIPRVSNLTIQTVKIDLSQVAGATQQLVRGYDVRLAKVEIHEAALDTASRGLVAAPAAVFLGEVDGAPIETPAVGGKGRISLKVVSDAISMLTRKNPAKSSYEQQRRRGGDEWGKHSSTIETWKIPWGQKS